MDAFISNTNLLELVGLYSAADEAYINDAAVTFMIVDRRTGEEVDGISWPQTMEYVPASNGDYRGIVPHDAGFVEGVPYTAIITANGGIDRIGVWEFPITLKTRRI